uniref:Methyltransferase type 11 domain-containing protein n=1 Tax=Zea mays TaxID=4577 RepID=A0A804N0B1_MAIZE
MAVSTTRSPAAIDRHAVRLITRVSIAMVVVATLSLLYLLRHASIYCFPASHQPALTISLAPFPRSSCDAASRRLVPPDHRLAKLRASPRWRRRAASLATSAFPPLRGLGILAAPSRVLCLAAGAGHAVDAFRAAGTRDAIGVDLVEFPPLVRRADPHHPPFSDGAFDLVFSDDPSATSGALFPSRLAREAERAVRRGGGIALAFDREIETVAVATLFKRSRVLDVKDVTLDGSQYRRQLDLERPYTKKKERGSEGSSNGGGICGPGGNGIGEQITMLE